ncbi:hypothetical protein CDAR_612831 [Caerostris darwini]|uniref:Uncharacterized protein n=1 Tax=Caerostris darwini TaxID=1538125 RepID=A0AAV4UAX5_9ARAC|nr:hypothetical protein CDAR_612831 [Caerostris darwini]
MRRSTTPFGQVHQERVIQNLWIQRVASIPSELLALPIFHETLSEEERWARITTVTKKKDLAQNLYDAYAARLTGYSPDDDDLKELKRGHDDLQHAMRECMRELIWTLIARGKELVRSKEKYLEKELKQLNTNGCGFSYKNGSGFTDTQPFEMYSIKV